MDADTNGTTGDRTGPSAGGKGIGGGALHPVGGTDSDMVVVLVDQHLPINSQQALVEQLLRLEDLVWWW